MMDEEIPMRHRLTKMLFYFFHKYPGTGENVADNPRYIFVIGQEGRNSNKSFRLLLSYQTRQK